MIPFLFDLEDRLAEAVDFFGLLAAPRADLVELLPPVLLDLAAADVVAFDLVEVDLPFDDFAAAVPDLPALEDPDFEVELAFTGLLFLAPPVLRLEDDLLAVDLLAVEPPADLDLVAVDFEVAVFDAVDFLELDVERDFGFDELVDFLVVGIFRFLQLQIGFEKDVRTSAIDVPLPEGIVM
jgi:hypothetical protein